MAAPIPADKLRRKLAVPSQGRLYYLRYALKMGWTIGCGMEFAIAPRFTVRAEYLRVEFPASSTTGQITNPLNGFFNPTTFSGDLKADIVRVGASYKFEWLPTHEVMTAPEPAVVISKN